MAQWDVYLNPSLRGRAELPYLVVVQSDLLESLATRLVLPLARDTTSQRGLPKRLAPAFRIGDDDLVLLPQEAGPIDARVLGRPVASLRRDAHRIVDALDAVVSGL